jgi:hypothetical protein
MRISGTRKPCLQIPAAMSRLAVVGILASLVTTAVIYSRDGNAAARAGLSGSGQAFIQPKDRQVAEAMFIPTPKVADASENVRMEVADAVPLPRPRPVTPGYYYDLVRAQGDGEEGDYVRVERQCIPNVDMPVPCYLPERGRESFPLRSE